MHKHDLIREMVNEVIESEEFSYQEEWLQAQISRIAKEVGCKQSTVTLIGYAMLLGEQN